MPNGSKMGGWFRLYECLFVVFACWFIVHILPLLIPLGVADYLWRESRLRRLYRRRHLDWNRQKETILHKGTLIIECHFEYVGRLWWLPDDLRARYPDCPLAPTSVLEASFDEVARFMLLRTEAMKTWWESHLQEFCDDVHLVSVPCRVRRKPEALLTATNAVVVADDFTFGFYRWT